MLKQRIKEEEEEEEEEEEQHQPYLFFVNNQEVSVSQLPLPQQQPSQDARLP